MATIISDNSTQVFCWDCGETSQGTVVLTLCLQCLAKGRNSEVLSYKTPLEILYELDENEDLAGMYWCYLERGIWRWGEVVKEGDQFFLIDVPLFCTALAIRLWYDESSACFRDPASGKQFSMLEPKGE